MSEMEPNAGVGRVGGMYLSSPLPGTPAVSRRRGIPPDLADRPPIHQTPPTAAPAPAPKPEPEPEPEMTYVAAEATPVAVGFDAFYRAKRAPIATALALALGDVDIATDATDEAMTRAYERWSTVSQLDRPEAWVYRVASNWAMSIFRRRRRSLHRLYDPSVADAAMSVDPAVHRAVAALDIKQRSVVVCRHLLGWSVAETADALGISQGTVKSRLHRATTILRSQLRDLHTPEEPS